SKAVQIPQLQQIGLSGVTAADIQSSGFRTAVTWGEEKCPQLTVGLDMRYLSQYLNEFDNLPPNGIVNNPIPRSPWSDPGLFVDAVLPVTDKLTLRAGFRADIVTTDIDKLPPGPLAAPTHVQPGDELRIMALAYGTAKWDNEFNTMAGFFSGEYKLDEHLTPFMNFGIAQSPPSLTELYALSPFLAVVQNGLNSVIGNPALTPEQAWQLEFGLRANYERF